MRTATVLSAATTVFPSAAALLSAATVLPAATLSGSRTGNLGAGCDGVRFAGGFRAPPS